MGISETIAAAMIGAIATVSTALFQLFTALRNKGKVDARPKRGMTLRSVLAVLALMVASAAGGFLYSELMRQRAADDMRAMRQELKELKHELTARVRGAEQQLAETVAPDAAASMNASLSLAAMQGAAAAVESMAYVPACRTDAAGAACTEADAQRIALCAAVPFYARVDRIELYAQPDAVQNAWDEHRAQIEQDVGGARFTGKSFEYAQSEDLKTVCVGFMHWSSERPHIARMLVHYAVGHAPELEPAPREDDAAAPSSTPAVVSADAHPAGVAHAVLTDGAAARAEPVSTAP